MTENAQAKISLIGEFKALTPKQWIAVVAAFAIALFLVYTGLFLSMCLGFFIVAVLLYMVPHITGVSSPRVKAVIGALFIVVILALAAFAYADSAKEHIATTKGNTILTDCTFEDDVITVVSDDEDLDLVVSYAPITGISFGNPSMYDKSAVVKIYAYEMTYADGKYICEVPLEAGKYYYIETSVNVDNPDLKTEYWQVIHNTGISKSDVNALSIAGSWLSIVEIGVIFFLMLILSEVMRRGARKKRDQMVKDGRLYPPGYDKCKNCGTLVLPGEITCRKCGAPIEVPEDVKVLHKKDFFECSECGTEVPLDAKFCPKCGAMFDEKTEAEITHEDGTVDVSSDTFECSECGKEVPANATRCPYCGAEFDEDDDN